MAASLRRINPAVSEDEIQKNVLTEVNIIAKLFILYDTGKNDKFPLYRKIMGL